MSRLRWAKFFWDDWRTNAKLHLCSLPAQGVWIGMLALASQGEPYGVLRFNGNAATPDDLYRMIAPQGTRRSQFMRWLAELERHGVCTREHDGSICSTRMKHDGDISSARTQAAHKSWEKQQDQRQPRNLHVQPNGNGRDLYVQNKNLHVAEAEAEAEAEKNRYDSSSRYAREASGQTTEDAAMADAQEATEVDREVRNVAGRLRRKSAPRPRPVREQIERLNGDKPPRRYRALDPVRSVEQQLAALKKDR